MTSQPSCRRASVLIAFHGLSRTDIPFLGKCNASAPVLVVVTPPTVSALIYSPIELFETNTLLEHSRVYGSKKGAKKAQDCGQSAEVGLVFYDSASSCCERSHSPLVKYKYRYSGDQRSDRLQINPGLLVTPEGIPIAHEIFSGNVAEKNTLFETIAVLTDHFHTGECVFVADLGMVSDDNLSLRCVRRDYGTSWASRNAVG